MNTKKLQELVNKTFKENFGYTSFTQRMADIDNEYRELIKWNDINNIKEETGDLLASLIKLCVESGWNFDDLVQSTLKKINTRSEQYKSLGRKVKVAILGGAFNPIHTQHIKVAQFVLNVSGRFDEVWLLPAYNHMGNKEMESAEHRLEMCKIAAECDRRIKVFDYEIKNKLAGETFNFFNRLKEEKDLEKYQFSMIIGLDNANSFKTWVNFEELERMVQFVIIPRAGVKRIKGVDWYLKAPHIYLNNEKTGITDLSSTQIRKEMDYYINERLDHLKYVMNPLVGKVDDNVWRYIIEHNLYKK
jgi:nicotinate (nicotinamide) nucleotide adenylyltransferase